MNVFETVLRKGAKTFQVWSHGEVQANMEEILNLIKFWLTDVIGSESRMSLKIWQRQDKWKFLNHLETWDILGDSE